MDTTKILIGYDGSHASRCIIDDLRRAGLPASVECHVVSYTEAWVPAEDEEAFEQSVETPATVMPPTRGVLSLERAQHLALEFAREVREAFPEWVVTAQAHANAPEHGLVDAAREWPADIVVVGTHGRSAMIRALLGSVSQHVLAHAPCTVRIARPPSAAVGALRVLIATDGSKLAYRAVDAVVRRQWPVGSAAKVVTVDELLDASLTTAVTMPVGLGVASVPSAAALRDRVQRAADVLDESGLAIEARVLEGAPVEAILAEARRWGADVIFVGAQGHTLFERIALGSVSAAIAARAACSVEIVR